MAWFRTDSTGYGYNEELHKQNLDAVHAVLETFEIPEQPGVTPWLVGDEGMVALKGLEKTTYSASIVTHHDSYFWSMGPHFAKHDIQIDKNAISGKTKVYPALRTVPRIFLYEAGMMMGYPSVRYNPVLASEIINATLGTQELSVATQEIYNEAPPPGAWILRHWVGVKIPEGEG